MPEDDDQPAPRPQEPRPQEPRPQEPRPLKPRPLKPKPHRPGPPEPQNEPPGLTIDDRLLAALAREVEAGDPIAWGEVKIDRDTAFRLMASQIAEIFRGYEQRGVARDQQLIIALSSAVKLSVENFVLHQRIVAREAGSGQGER